MLLQSQLSVEQKPFAATRAHILEVLEALEAGSTKSMDHTQMESHILEESREIARRMLQDALDQASNQDRQLKVVGSDNVERTHQKRSTRALMSVVGPVQVNRETYAARNTPMLAPVDAALNLPVRSYSFGVQRHVAEQAARVSFDATVRTVEELAGINIPKRQAEEQTALAAVDFDAFYAQRKHVCKAEQTEQTKQTKPADDAADDDFLVISVDGKGIVMRHDSLRDSTQKKAADTANKLDKRLSKGEKKDRKRMAQVAAVYSIKRHERTAQDIVAPLRHLHDTAVKPAPKPTQKRVWASIKKPMEGVNSDVFDEASARDPEHKKQWVALVDGNKNQLGDIMALADHHKVDVTCIIDIIHVIQYLWLAVWCFFSEGDKDAQDWVTQRLTRILQGQSSQVAAGIRRSATNQGLEPTKRRGADKCADYLLRYKRFLRYDTYLKAGMPIATGVIEGACRHLVKDRMDITGARWSTDGAEAILQMRALLVSGDIDEYWAFHQKQEYSRNHASKYANKAPPNLPLKAVSSAQKKHLTCVC